MAVAPLLHHLFLLLPLALTFPSQPTIASADTADLIHDTCKQTLHNDLCVAMLESGPSSKKADLKGLVVIALKAAQASASATSGYIAELRQGSATEPFMEQCLHACWEQFLDIIDQMEDSLGALETHGYKDAITWVSAAVANAESCEEDFNDQPGHKSPLTSNNGDLTKLCSIALAILKLMS